MDVTMEDAVKTESRDSAPQYEAPSIPVLDSWIDSLMSCKQLSEADVTKLCDKVSARVLSRVPARLTFLERLAKCCRKSPTCSLW